MKISDVLTKKEKEELSSVLPHVDLEKDYTEDKWDELVDAVQDKAIDLLQSDTKNAAYIDDIAAKISAHEE